MAERVAGVILAGGQARRMNGVDKTALCVGGRTILTAVISALEINDIAISANGDPARFVDYGFPVLPDGAFCELGPLGGVLAGLNWASRHNFDVVVTVPGDMPFLPRGIVPQLLPAPMAAVHRGQRHHLVASWPVSVKSTLRSFLRLQGSRRVADFAAIVGSRDQVLSFAPDHVFTNVNTLEDLNRARKIFEEIITHKGPTRAERGS